MPLGQVRGGGDLAVSQLGQGTTISMSRPFANTWIRDVVDIFPAVITDSTPYTDSEGNTVPGRFKYSWYEAEFHNDDWETFTNGRVGDFDSDSTYALSAIETFHTTTYQGGVDITSTSYTATAFGYRPAGGGGTDNTHKINMPAQMWEVIKKVDTPDPGNPSQTIQSAVLGYLFWGPNSHDGNCS